jgi:hypothetical protein
MPTNSYFTLTTSDGELTRRFAVIQSGFEPVQEKMQTVNTTVNGGLDVALGAIYETHSYIVRVRHTETRPGYGNKDDLEAFYRLNDPGAVKSPVIKMTDHHGMDHNVYMLGQHMPIPLAVSLEGTEAFFNVKCTFRFIP